MAEINFRKAKIIKQDLIAHLRKKDSKIQPLWNHLEEVSELAGNFASKVDLIDCGKVIGLLHDIGKASQEFQEYIKSATGMIDPDQDEFVDAFAMKGKIDHSTAGAQIIHSHLSVNGAEGKLTVQILALCIASHHSGLIDCLLPSGEDNYSKRINKATEKTHLNEVWSNLCNQQKEKLLELLSDKRIILQLVNKLKTLKENNDSKETLAFKCGLLIRFLFSCLIDADRLSTIDFEFPFNKQIRNYGNYLSWSVLLKRFNTKMKEFDGKQDRNEVDNLRKEVSQKCLEFATKPKGIYQLTVPTGGGKTLSSLRFALNHALHHKMDRIFYIIPFTSIIDQNADVVRKILEDRDATGKYLDNVVLEHHSNLTPDEETKRQNLLAENWDAPVVFTTQVQFLETLFGGGTRSARRMHQLANSVIIFDEAQTLPVRCVHMFNIALRFLVNNCNSSIVLCTATQPLLDKIEPRNRSLSISNEQKIIQNDKELFQKLKRTEVFDIRREPDSWSEDEVVELAERELKEMGSVLIIVNKKDSARSLYQKFFEKQLNDIYHLSTNMCPTHRLDVLNTVKERLNNKLPVICISTQLIEAGVDVDFGTVIRYLASLDSITQAAGRCNRDGRRKKGRVYIVNPKDENLDRLKDIKIGANDAGRVLREFKNNPDNFDNDPLGVKATEQFYRYYFYHRSHEMNYPVAVENPITGRADNLFDLLSLNPGSVAEYIRINNAAPSLAFKQSFQSAAKLFQVIDSPTRGVIVPYKREGEDIINQLCAETTTEKQFKYLKVAQKYSVNLYPYEIEDMIKKKAISEIPGDSGILYLDYMYYSNHFGWSKEIVTEMKDLIF